MKRAITLCLALVFVLSMVGCKTGKNKSIDIRNEYLSGTESRNFTENQSEEPLQNFSYEKDSAIYKTGDPGVKTHEFVNVNTHLINNQNEAIQQAENERTIEYDTTAVCYDPVSDIWRVLFYTEGILGGCQTVYMDSNGITCLIVYGE